MLKIFPNRESGTSMVELIIAAGLMALVGLGASQFFKRTGEAEYEARAKASAIGEMALLTSAMERDFKLRDIDAATTKNAICGNCDDFTIASKVKVGAGDQPMNIRYQSVCAALPSNMVGKVGSLNFKRPYNASTPAYQGQCFRSVANKCGQNQVPQIVVTMNAPGGAKLPSYPGIQGNVARFPNLNAGGGVKSASASVIAAAVCASSGGSKTDRVIVESAFLNSQGDFRIEKKEVSIPRSNVARIQMLPAGP